MLTLTLHNYLFNKFTIKYGPKTASTLAPAIANGLFGFDIFSEDGENRKFLISNKNLVFDELKELSEKQEVCNIVSVAAYVLGGLNGSEDAFPPGRINGAKVLREFGILLPKESIEMPSSSNAFRLQVCQFQRWTLLG